MFDSDLFSSLFLMILFTEDENSNAPHPPARLLGLNGSNGDVICTRTCPFWRCVHVGHVVCEMLLGKWFKSIHPITWWLLVPLVSLHLSLFCYNTAPWSRQDRTMSKSKRRLVQASVFSAKILHWCLSLSPFCIARHASINGVFFEYVSVAIDNLSIIYR